jgi:HAD superfamily hydrolase (TIGR01509 family)
MHVPPPPAGVAFDLDGTLVDTVEARITSWANALAERGLRASREQLGPLIGMDGRQLARDVAAGLDRVLSPDEEEALDRRSGELFNEENRSPRALVGVTAALERLDRMGVPWVIATSSRAEQVAPSIAALALSREPRVVDGSHVRNAKPAPDLLFVAAEELGTEPSRTWYVGDATWDMRAAVAAGMLGIGVLAGAAVSRASLIEAGAVLVVDSLDQLPIGR